MFDLIPLWAVAVLEIITGAGVIAFWVIFYTTKVFHPENPPEGYFAHEGAFVYPDSLMAAGLIASGILLLLNISLGQSLSLVCAGSLMFLGTIDIAYDYKNGLFSGSTFEFFQHFAIDLWVLAFGLFLILRFLG